MRVQHLLADVGGHQEAAVAASGLEEVRVARRRDGEPGADTALGEPEAERLFRCTLVSTKPSSRSATSSGGSGRVVGRRPDGEAIPRVKKLLGHDWYWEEFSERNGGEPSALWQALLPGPEANERRDGYRVEGRVSLQSRMSFRSAKYQEPSNLANMSRYRREAIMILRSPYSA